jgi:hypothetical protein
MEFQQAVKELGQACANLASSLYEWWEANREIITKRFPFFTNNGRKRYGLPMYRRQAIRKAKVNSRKKV